MFALSFRGSRCENPEPTATRHEPSFIVGSGFGAARRPGMTGAQLVLVFALASAFIFLR